VGQFAKVLKDYIGGIRPIGEIPECQAKRFKYSTDYRFNECNKS
jgi:hypothetical protein